MNSSKKKLSNGCETQGAKGIVKRKRWGTTPSNSIITKANRLKMEDDYSNFLESSFLVISMQLSSSKSTVPLNPLNVLFLFKQNLCVLLTRHSFGYDSVQITCL